MRKKKLDKDILNWLEWEIDCAGTDIEDAEQREEDLNEALGQYKKTGSLPKDMRKEYNDWGKGGE